jgi:hypothetical protein
VLKVNLPKPTEDKPNDVDLKFGVNNTSLKLVPVYNDDKLLPIQNVGIVNGVNVVAVEANVWSTTGPVSRK